MNESTPPSTNLRQLLTGLRAALANPWTWRMAWRDSRTQRRRLAVFASAIVSGITALVAIHALKSTLQTGVNVQAKALLGSDLEVVARHPFPEDAAQDISSHAKEVSRETSLSTMVSFPTAQAARLVLVRGVSGGFPYYGHVDTEPASAWTELKDHAGILLEPALLDQFQAHVGDKVKLGSQELPILGAIKKSPTRAGRAGGFAPEAYMRLADLDNAGLLSKSSLAYYHLHLKDIPDKDVKALKDKYGGQGWRFETPEDRRDALGNALENFQRFLGMIAMAALVLGALGVAGAVHNHVARRLPSVAVLRCLGCPGDTAFAIYLVQAISLALVATFIGAVLGGGIAFFMLDHFQDSLPVPLNPAPSLWVIIRTAFVGLAVCIGFALQPLLQVRNVAPAVALREAWMVSTSRRRAWRSRLLLWAFLVLLVTLLARLNTNTWLRALALSGGLLAAFLLLAGLAKFLTWAARRLLSPSWPYLLRQGISNLYRPRNQTLLFLLSLGLGAFLLVTILLLRDGLQDSINLRKMPESPNIYLVDVQHDELDGVRSLLTTQHLPFLESAPVVTMRLQSIKGVPLKELEKNPKLPKWLLQREYRSTYRSHLTSTEEVISGKWIEQAIEGQMAPVSLDSDIAKDLEVAVGDEIELDVQGVPLKARVTSLRKVDWSKFGLNFWMVFPTGVLEAAPSFDVVTTRVPENMTSGDLQRALVQKFPNVSAIDLTLILTTVRSLLDKLGYVIGVLAGFTLLAGLPILIGTLWNARDQRIQESVLLRTLGASSTQVRTILMVEYTTLGLLAAGAGVVLGVFAHAALAQWVFETSPWPNFAATLGVGGGLIILALGAGSVLSRGVCTHPPLEILRKIG